MRIPVVRLVPLVHASALVVVEVHIHAFVELVFVPASAGARDARHVGIA